MSSNIVKRNKTATPSPQDLQVGGPGNDVFYVNDSGEVVQDTSAADRDVVYASVNWVMTAGSRLEVLSSDSQAGTAPLQLSGNEFTQEIYGNAGANFIDGGGGRDFLFGFAGNDTYIVDSADDDVFEQAGEGTDVIYTSANYTLAAGTSIEVLSVMSQSGTSPLQLIGNELAQEIYGNAGANYLDGGSGNDTLVGFGGNDSFVVDDNGDYVTEAAGGGSDIVYVRGSFTLGSGQEVETLAALSQAGTAPIVIVGNELGQVIYGNAGANYLDGGSGNDTLVGFGGNDSFVVDDNGDYVAEAAGGGSDIVYVRGSFTLGAAQEVETLAALSQAGTAPIVIVGNELGQVIYGNAGANYLDGGSGNDTLVGFGGNDSFVVDDNGDYVAEAPGGGSDIVYVRGSFTLGAGQEVENLAALSQAGTAPIVIVGNELGQVIYGNNGDNYLDGGSGTDVLQGFAGNDVYVVDSLDDQVVEVAGQGSDVVYARSSYVLGAGQDIEVLSAINQAATLAMDLTGNATVNQLYGNAGANVIDGGGAADYLMGFAGADTFAFTTTLGGGNIDTVADFQAGVDKIQLSGAAGQPFEALASGTLRAGAFVVGSAALDADDYLIYNSANGALLYDSDGNGGNAAVQFATLGTGLSLTAADFLVSGPANNAPTVTSAATAGVVENTPTSNVVYQATATDADGDRFTWSLGGTDAGLFTIDAVTGAVRLVTAADFETRTSYNFTVIASDSGTPAGSRPVVLSVTDVNDTPATPIINETASANDSVGSAQTVDRNILTVNANSDLHDQSLPSATIVGSVSANSDVDFFSITLQAGEKLILDIDRSSGGLDSYLRIYGPNGVELGSNDDLVSFDPGSVSTIAPHNTDSFISFRAPSAGTYYFSVEAFGDLNNDGDDDGPTVGESSGSYSLNVSIGPPATMAQLISEDIDALISGSRWPGTSLTYGFPTLASQYPAGIKETDTPGDSFGPFSAQQQAVTIAQLGMISQVSALTFTQNTVNPGATQLRWAMSNEAEVAYAYYPPASGNPGGLGGSAWFNVSGGRFNNPVLGNYAWMGILHETGHALGLKHGHESPAIQADRDSVEYTVMTYRSYPGRDLSGGGGYRNETWGYPQSLMMYDIAALQRIYGANFATNNGDTVYSFSPSTGEMSINGTAQGAPGANRVFLTIWDGGGTDSYDMSNYGTNLTIDLRPGEWTRLGGQLAGLGDGNFARGNIANALQFEGNPASLIENAIGGTGTDSLIANQAANQLTGNGGADTFKWMAGSDAGTGASADRILDFAIGTDKIDLSGVDAISGTSPDDAFTFIGTGAFTNTAGQLRYEVTGGHAHIFADLDGNGLADMEIIVNNVGSLTGSDFIL